RGGALTLPAAEPKDKESEVAKRVKRTDPTLQGLLRGLASPTEGDASARALADFLEERGDPRAGDVRELVEARPVIPAAMPRCLRPANPEDWDATFEDILGEPTLLEECLSIDLHARLERLPMACGSWWAVERIWLGVSSRVYVGTPP